MLIEDPCPTISRVTHIKRTRDKWDGQGIINSTIIIINNIPIAIPTMLICRIKEPTPNTKRSLPTTLKLTINECSRHIKPCNSYGNNSSNINSKHLQMLFQEFSRETII